MVSNDLERAVTPMSPIFPQLLNQNFNLLLRFRLYYQKKILKVFNKTRFFNPISSVTKPFWLEPVPLKK
jgi:hypothetical protein